MELENITSKTLKTSISCALSSILPSSKFPDVSLEIEETFTKQENKSLKDLWVMVKQ